MQTGATRSRWVGSLRTISLVLLGFGALIRLVQYLYNRSLWADEAKLAINIAETSYGGFSQPLAYDQAAPIAFLWVEKLAVQIWGNHEYALRLFPLVAALVSLILFYQLTADFLDARARPVAIALFASNQYLVYYASEVKQYSGDVLAALAVMLVLMRARIGEMTLTKAAVAGLVGAIAIWFSHPVVFVLAGVEAVYLARDISSGIANRSVAKLHQTWKWRLTTYTCWLVSFTMFYRLTLTDIRNNEFFLFTWADIFPQSAWDLGWFFERTWLFFYKPLAFPTGISELAIVLVVLGGVAGVKSRQTKCFLLLVPGLLTLIAGYLRQYPVDNRFLLFLVPSFIILITQGLFYSLDLAHINNPIKRSILIFLLIFFPIIEGGLFLDRPYLYENIKPVLAYVQRHQQPDDIIYVFQKGKVQFQYYADRYGFEPYEYQIGIDLDDDLEQNISTRDERLGYQRDINQLRGNSRVWFLVSDSRTRDETEFILDYFETIGQKIDGFVADVPTSFAYLYDLSEVTQPRVQKQGV